MAYRTQTDKEVERLLPPQSLDAEQAVLGSILKEAEAINQAIEVLDSENFFYFPKHQIIYRAMLDLYDRSEPCDITTVANALLKGDKLEKIGGRVYLVELAESVATTANIAVHANIVLEKSLLRRLIQTSNEIVKSCYALERPVENILDLAEQNIFDISESRLRKGFASIGELIPSTFEAIEDLQSPDSALVGIKTGFEQLDVMTNGLHKGDLVIVAGRPSMGKSALAVNIAEHISVELKKGVGIFSVSYTHLTLPTNREV